MTTFHALLKQRNMNKTSQRLNLRSRNKHRFLQRAISSSTTVSCNKKLKQKQYQLTKKIYKSEIETEQCNK